MTYNSDIRETASVLDMWYGDRRAWRDTGLPPEMDLHLSNPAYRDHDELSYREAFSHHPVDGGWRSANACWHDHVDLLSEALTELGIL